MFEKNKAESNKLWQAVKFKKVLILAIILVILGLVLGKIYQDREETRVELEKIIPSHSCVAQPFRIYLLPGESVNFRVQLNESELGKSYRVYLGDLPRGVTATLLNYEGQQAQEALVELNAATDAQLGDFSIMINYNEQLGRGVEKNVKCQFNLIIEN